MADVVLKPGHVRPVWAGHPWVFAQGVGEVIGQVAAGDEVRVVDPKQKVLGRGLYSPASAIRVRLYTRHPEQSLDADLLRQRLTRALARRQDFGLPSPETNAFRVLNAEGDGVPGLVVDLLGDVVMMQLLSVGMARRRELVVSVLAEALSPRAIVDRTPARSAKLDGFEPAPGVVLGEAPDLVSFNEGGLRFEVPLTLGQKTGYYLDMRPLRTRLASLAVGRSVLDCYCFIAAAGLRMAHAGARDVLCVDSSAAAVETGRRLAAVNGLAASLRVERGKAQAALKQAAEQGGYDLVLCDPPKLMPDRASLERALAAMQQLARAAALATRPGGLLVLCSCSAGLGMREVTRALALGAAEAGRHATVLERAYQDFDHPVPAAFSEGLYLSAVIAQIDLDK